MFKTKKAKKYQHKYQQKPQQGLESIQSGFLITCDKNREREAVKEGYNIIERFVEQLYPDKDIQEKILYNFDTKCVIFLKINKKFDLDVDYIARSFYNEIYDNHQQLCRYCYKLIPIRYVFQADIKVFQEKVQILIKEYFNLEKPTPWFLVYKARYTQKFTKNQILEEIRNLMEPLHFQDWKDPELVFYVELNGAIMYLNILPNYSKYEEYSTKKSSETDFVEQKSQLSQKFIKAPVEQLDVKISEVEDFKKEQFYEEKEFDIL